MVLYANAGHVTETVISGASSTAPKVSGSTSISAKSGSNGTVIITGEPTGLSAVSFGKTVVLVAPKETALSFWNVHLPSTSATIYDRAPDVPSVLVLGPYLVRNASLADNGSVLVLQGDLNATTTLQVFAPASVRRVTWNGANVKVTKSPLGALTGTLTLTAKAPELPDLKTAEWSCTNALPEVQDGFDDTAWVVANKTSTARPYQPFAGKVCML